MFYNRAKTIFPHEGKVYRALAQLAVKDSDYLSAIYNCMRALSCAYPSSSSETRETLINLFQEIRMKDIEECKLEVSEHDEAAPSRKQRSMAAAANAERVEIDTVSEAAFNRFLMCFFRIQNILFTRIGIDELENLHERFKSLLRAYLTQSVDSTANKTDHVKKLIYVSMILIFIAHSTITDS